MYILYCHHLIIYAKFNLKIYYPPPYEREIWHYKKAKNETIRKAINQFPWVTHFTYSGVNEKVSLFNKTSKNIILNYIRHEKITCVERDLPWINKGMKELIYEKNQVWKSYRQNKCNTFSQHQFEFFQSQLNCLTEKSKLNYYTHLSKILLDLMTSQKSYWSSLKTFINNKKIPCIPKLHDDKFITNFKKKD